jgi:Family of unknown function (DUF6077)
MASTPRRSGRAARAPERLARVGDALLELGVLALAAWTVLYHVCLGLHVPAVWAAVAEALAFIPCAFVAAGRPRRWAAAAEPAPSPAPRRDRRTWRRAAAAANVVAAVAAAAVFGWVRGVWVPIWLLWVVAALAALAATFLPAREDPAEDAPAAADAGGAVATVAWGVGLAVLSLFIVRPDTDDAQYVHLSAWIADHGRFPLRDIMFSDGNLPSLFFPPLSSYEALVGTFARGIPVSVPDLVYLGVTPVASLAAVFALWRLLRTWRVPLAGLALTASVVFLLFEARGHWMPGSYFIGRIWQGKVIYVAVLLPFALSLLAEHAARPSRRGLVLLLATGIAAVGLTTTAIFTLPVLAVACLIPALRRRPGTALAGMAATAAYPLAMGVLTLVVGGRNPDQYTDSQTTPLYLVHHALGRDQFGAIALFAILAGAVAIPRRTAARMAAVTLAVLAVLYANGVPDIVFDLTGLGRVLWRMTWLMPAAALLGALVVRAVPARAPLAVRAAPALALCVLMVVVGVPVWAVEARGSLASHPAWKLWAHDAADAKAILAAAPPNPRVLAPHTTGQALLAISGTVTVVNPLDRYTKSLKQFHPRGKVKQRVVLEHFVKQGFGVITQDHPRRYVRHALHVLRVDVACAFPGHPTDGALLAAAGWTHMRGVPGLSCWRARP